MTKIITRESSYSINLFLDFCQASSEILKKIQNFPISHAFLKIMRYWESWDSDKSWELGLKASSEIPKKIQISSYLLYYLNIHWVKRQQQQQQWW